MKPALFLAALFLAAAPASAQLISGVVHDPMGNPLPGVNINCYDSQGDEVNLSNDGTDAFGNFLTLISDGPGTYTIEFIPPLPPTTTYLTKHVANVVVPVGTANMGTITMEPGVALFARVVRAGPVPVGNVRLQVTNSLTGNDVPLRQVKTNLTGEILVTVPASPVELALDASSASVVLASKVFPLSLTVDTDVGDLLLPPGITITGTVRRQNGTAIDGVDLDFRNLATGNKEYTPNDNSNALGNFAVVVAAGTYDVEFCPTTAEALAGVRLSGRVLNVSTSLGIVTLPNGIRLSGTITHLGSPVPGADVDVFTVPGGADVFLCNDNANASGAYSVYVPSGTYDVVFSPPPCSTMNQATHLGVAINVNTVLNGVLPTYLATSAVWAGDGINADLVAPVNMVVGQNWNAPLTLGHTHGAGGPVSLKIRTGIANGPNVSSPIGGRPLENLINGPVLAVISGSHNGTSGGIATFPIPGDPCFVGQAWSAQYTVLGGGFADLSRAVHGVIGAQ